MPEWANPHSLVVEIEASTSFLLEKAWLLEKSKLLFTDVVSVTSCKTATQQFLI